MPQNNGRLSPAQYTFAPANKQIDFSGVPGFTLDGLIEVWHAPSGKLIYNGYDTSGTLGGTLAGSLLTLQFDTTAMASADRLFVIYNSLERDDRVTVLKPTVTGPLGAIPVNGAQSLTLNIISTTSINVSIQGSVDGTNFDQTLNGRLPNLYNNSGDMNAVNGAPYNTRVYDISAFRFIRVNVNSIAAGSPTLNLVLKTIPAPYRDVFVTAGIVQASFDNGAGVGYFRQAMCNTEAFRSQVAANATFTGASRQANGQPNPYLSRFGATVVTDQSGTLSIQCSTDNTNWITVAQQAVQGGVPLDLEVKVRAPFYRAVFANGANATSANGFSLLTAFCNA